MGLLLRKLRIFVAFGQISCRISERAENRFKRQAARGRVACISRLTAQRGLLIKQRPRCQKSYGKTSTGLGEDFLLLVL
jgi:hypothetical protein